MDARTREAPNRAKSAKMPLLLMLRGSKVPWPGSVRRTGGAASRVVRKGVGICSRLKSDEYMSIEPIRIDAIRGAITKPECARWRSEKLCGFPPRC